MDSWRRKEGFERGCGIVVKCLDSDWPTEIECRIHHLLASYNLSVAASSDLTGHCSEYKVKGESFKVLGTSVQFSSVAQSCLTLCDPMDCSMPGFPVHQQLPELTQTHVHWVSDVIQPSHPLSSPSPPALIFPSIRVFSNESVLHIRWPKDWSFSFSISPSSEYSGLISFRIDWFVLLVVQGTLKSLQHHNSKASILQCSAFFMYHLVCY